MEIDYRKYPMLKYSKPVNAISKDAYYHEVKDDFSEKGIRELKRFHTGEFNLSGKSYILASPVNFSPENYDLGLFSYDGFVYWECDKDYYTDRSDLQSWMLCRTIGGRGVLEYDGRVYSLEEGDCFFIDCRNRHKLYSASKTWIHTVLHLQGKQCDHMFSLFRRTGSVIFQVKNLPTYDIMLDNVLRQTLVEDSMKDFRISAAIGTLLTAVVAEKCRPDAASRPVSDIRTYLQQHYNEPITLSALTKRYAISRAQLERVFFDSVGVSPIKYLTDVRLSHAADLILSTDLPITAIAEAVGYNSSSGFIEAFKNKYKCSPLKYRKKNTTIVSSNT